MQTERFTGFEVSPVIEWEGNDESRHCQAYESHAAAMAALDAKRIALDIDEDDFDMEESPRIIWTLYGRRADGTAEAISDNDTQAQAFALLYSLTGITGRDNERFYSLMLDQTPELETLYDLTSNLAADFATDSIDQSDMPDSRSRLGTLIEWANEFNTRHAGREWDGEYMEMVDEFYESKVAAIKTPTVDEKAN